MYFLFLESCPQKKLSIFHSLKKKGLLRKQELYFVSYRITRFHSSIDFQPISVFCFRPLVPEECRAVVQPAQMLTSECSRLCRNGYCTPTGVCCCSPGWEGDFCRIGQYFHCPSERLGRGQSLRTQALNAKLFLLGLWSVQHSVIYNNINAHSAPELANESFPIFLM